MKTFIEFPRDEKSGRVQLRVVLTGETGAEVALLGMAVAKLASISESPHDSSAIEMRVVLNATE